MMQMMNQYRPVEELPDNQNGTDEAVPTENGVQDVEMPLASSGEPKPGHDSGNVAQEDDASADDSKMEE
ncbi:hypothetical protein FCM35_KLT09430 [Carex littledalei]|uniref:Uncharacterized protein n=1 Tax=Carex littledalei TaxID=544730 RepID=A0A833VJT8_9POAL|nr:hypothetical protein FCM35_KLT09430 [Carex littledalei]